VDRIHKLRAVFEANLEDKREDAAFLEKYKGILDSDGSSVGGVDFEQDLLADIEPVLEAVLPETSRVQNLPDCSLASLPKQSVEFSDFPGRRTNSDSRHFVCWTHILPHIS